MDDVTVHQLKCSPDFFEDVLRGRKTFEVRKDDRGFAVGDMLCLIEYKPNAQPVHIVGKYTGRVILRKIHYILSHDQFPEALQPDYVVLGLTQFMRVVTGMDRRQIAGDVEDDPYSIPAEEQSE